MDLAAIRKKAKSAKEQDEVRPPASSSAPRPPLSVQGAPSGRDDFSNRPQALEPDAVLSEDDPLAALFATPLDLELATEETYLQALSSQEEKDDRESRKFLTFALDTEEYALDIACIREIIKPREITDIPRVPAFILGIISLRGIIIPVFDLKQRLKLGKVDVTPVSRIIVCQMEDRVVGLLVDHITQVVRLADDTIEPPPPVLTGIDRELVEGVGRHRDRMVILLHLPCVVDAQLV